MSRRCMGVSVFIIDSDDTDLKQSFQVMRRKCYVLSQSRKTAGTSEPWPGCARVPPPGRRSRRASRERKDDPMNRSATPFLNIVATTVPAALARAVAALARALMHRREIMHLAE